jgi:Nif-specific regulatory protein
MPRRVYTPVDTRCVLRPRKKTVVWSRRCSYTALETCKRRAPWVPPWTARSRGVVASDFDTDSDADVDKVRRERDLYLGLLQLDRHRDLEAFLERALGLIVELTGARCGYIELGADDPDGVPHTWWISHAYDATELDAVRTRVSRGIVAEAVASGATILTPSAMLDDRFAWRESVRLSRVSAALCAPVGKDPPIGVVYLESRDSAATFSDDDRVCAEVFGDYLAGIADRLIQRSLTDSAGDPAAPLRKKLGCETFVGRSHAFAAALQQAALVAPLDVPVLLTGDSGTGKTQLARIIHANSPRATGPFVELNCAALPEGLVESELFGAAAGAHSTARSAMDGKIAAAERGTLFLDEIGELPPAAQAKLLQFLQSKEYYRLGSTQPVRADVRVIAATNADLKLAVSEKKFREDLLYRLEVLPIRLPTLAERTEDLGVLMDHFLQETVRRHDLSPLALSGSARRAISLADWPGNLRQLAHAIEAAAIRASGSGAGVIEAEHVFPTAAPAGRTKEAESFQQATRRFQEELLRRTLEDSDWNIAECARRLDLARSHVYNLIRAFGIRRA